jgi:putative membrane protein
MTSAPSHVLGAAQHASLPFHSHPSVLLTIGGVGVFFWWAFTRLGPRLVAEGAAPGEVGGAVSTARQRHWIIAGCAWLFVFSYWPLHDLAEKYLFLTHMIQHTVFTLVAPACFLLGAPKWLWSWLLSQRTVASVLRVFSKPLLALLVFNALIAVTHLPQIVELSLRSEPFHFLVHLVLFLTATAMWVPVINRDPRLPRLSAPVKMVYLFAQSIVPTVPASFLTFSETPLYDTYLKAPRIIAALDAVEDQQIAAAIMKIGAGSFLWAIVGYLFYCWWIDTKNGVADDHASERARLRGARPSTGARHPQLAGMTITGGRVEDVLTWEQVEQEFARLDAVPDATTPPATA